MQKRSIVYKDTSTLIPYIGNSRTHSDAQVKQIAASIQEFGFTNPILIDEENGVIAGHGRIMAAELIEQKQIPCIVLSGLTAAQKKALVIADNQLALNADWDMDKLTLELESLLELDFDIDTLGFDDDFIENVLGQDKTEGLTEDDAIPDIPENPITVLGDIWTLGNHRLMCGDSTNIDTVERLMHGEQADMVFTDPPYGVEYQSNSRTKTAKFDVLINDDKILDIVPVIEAFSRGWCFIWTSWKVLDAWISNTASLGYPSNIVIWHKPGGGLGDLKKTFSTDYEVALVWNRGEPLAGKRIGSVWTVNKDGNSTYLHPTQKPVALAQEAIEKTTQSDSLVLDLFGGAGSTLIASEKISRVCYLMELDPKYCDVIIKRWEDFTGQDAIHAETGITYKASVNG